MQKEYEWNLKDAIFTKDKGKVFSCFACGGGSTMGYKLAGFDVIGFNEIDPRMAECYIKNHDPKYQFIEPIQTFKDRQNLPEELFDLDILDGSPPCSSFSMAGSREDAWGKKKKFREGQAEQVLDTLFFDFIDLAKRLQPKVVIAENVKGLLLGEAIHYARRIKEEFEKAGYYIQWKLLDASTMGVPQKRERVFFIALRKDLAEPFLEQINFFEQMPKLELEFNEKPVVFGEFREYHTETKIPKGFEFFFENQTDSENCMGETSERFGKRKYFNQMYQRNDRPVYTMSAKIDGIIVKDTPRFLTKFERLCAGTYPQDYDFGKSKPHYLIGMSVPPLMTKKIAQKIYDQWLSKIEVKK